MSQRKIKAARREQKEKAKDFEIRRDAMLADLKKLSEKYRIDVMGALQYTQQGIVPMVAFIDRKDQYEHLTEEAKKAELAKGNGELKNKLKV